MDNRMSTRLTILRRGSTGGSHWMAEKEDRFGHWRSEEVGDIIWGLGAMAAEYVFYGENTNGVGGDVQSATHQAAQMVGAAAMAPEPVNVTPLDDEDEKQARERVLKRFESIGTQIMNRTSGGGPMSEDPIGSVLGDPFKRAMAAQILGQAFLKAYHLVDSNRAGVERVADALMERKEMYGDEVVRLLDSVELEVPEVDLNEESTWPRM
jgi:ATP-dependent Zn protease